MKKSLPILLFIFLASIAWASNNKPKQIYYQIIVYHLKDDAQIQSTDLYLKNAYVPLLHKNGIEKIGVFKPITNDTSADKRIYVLIPMKSIDQVEKLDEAIWKDAEHEIKGAAYLNTPYTQIAFLRKETMLVKAFEGMPGYAVPNLTGTVAEKIYEFRSYEGPTEKLYRSKVDMFNAGQEIQLFERLQFNALFYGSVLVGAKMPNLVYMTSFNNIAERDAKWKSFSADPVWKDISTRPKYLNTVSHADIILTHATEYSDF
ncbi:MAG: NIPSNAP family protein [Bacteroidota bacterium]|jgi:NIPSNAP